MHVSPAGACPPGLTAMPEFQEIKQQRAQTGKWRSQHISPTVVGQVYGKKLKLLLRCQQLQSVSYAASEKHENNLAMVFFCRC